MRPVDRDSIHAHENVQTLQQPGPDVHECNGVGRGAPGRQGRARLKANVEGYVGDLGERDVKALRNFSLGAEQQAEKAAQALGYYQAQIDSEIQDGPEPRLVIKIKPGEPIHLRNVVIRVDGPAASLAAFKVPKSDALKTGAVLNHGNYEDAKRLIQNQASRFGFFSGHFTRQRLAIDRARASPTSSRSMTAARVTRLAK